MPASKLKEARINLHPTHIVELLNGKELKAYSKSGDWLFIIRPPVVIGEPVVAELDVEEIPR